MDTTVIPIHTKVSGRARFRIRSFGLFPEWERRLGTGVERLPGVERAAVNPVTGSVLVFFDPEIDWRTIAEGIQKVMQTAPDGNGAPWHQLAADELLERVASSPDQGLAPDVAGRRLRRQGANVIQETRLRSRLETLKDQFRFLPMALLLGESVAAFLGGAAVEAALLAGITAVNLAAGFLIDRRAEEALAAYQHRPRPPARALRGGAWVQLPGEALVVGDVVKLAPGTYVGADCRILEADHLKIDESLLTGESRPVDKHADAIPPPPRPLFDQHNMAFMGTLVVGGEGLAAVVATGPLTEYGKLSRLYAETIPPQTPVVDKIHALSGTLFKTAMMAGLGVYLVGLLRGQPLFTAAGRALSITASAVPAGLPSAATVNMALGFRRLKQEQVSIRRLYSLESLSAVQTICFDKTGTLTRSRIDVQRIYCGRKEIHVAKRTFWDAEGPFPPLDDPDCRRLLKACVLCSEARGERDPATGRRRFTGSPTEAALLHLAILAGIDPDQSHARHPLLATRHRNDARRYMTTAHGAPGGRTMVFVKGAPLEVLDLCAFELRGGKRVRLSAAARSTIELYNQRMAGEALRVLGFAYGSFPGAPEGLPPPGELTWIGLVGMAEPIRKGVPPLMDRLKEAGIQTVMVTGDQSVTAEAVARRIRLGGRPDIRIFDSSGLKALTPELAAALIRNVQVFARLEPAQKLQLVKAFQDQGMVVAMTGDGINDSPALRAADVGIAMGLSGTDAACEVADMVLERDNIASIHTAVLEGRAAYRNLKRSLRYFIGTHFSDLILATTAALLPGTDLFRFRPVQIDLLTDLTPGLALLMEPTRPDIGREPPRDRVEPLFPPRDLRALATESAVLAGGALAAYGYGLARYGPGARAATLAFESLSGAKALHALTCRPWTPGAGQPPANPFLNAALAATLTAQAATLLVPGLRRLLGIAPLGLADLAVMGGAAWATRLVNRRIRGSRQVNPAGA